MAPDIEIRELIDVLHRELTRLENAADTAEAWKRRAKSAEHSVARLTEENRRLRNRLGK